MTSPPRAAARALVLPGLAALLSLPLASCSDPASSDQTPAAEPLTVRVLTVRDHDTLTIERTYRGQLEPRRRSALGFDLAGTVTRLRADEGDRVGAGELLATLDLSRLEARLRQLDAATAEAESGRALAASTLARFERAAERAAVSPQELEEARRGEEAAQATLARVQAERDLVAVDLDKARLRAPYHAVVTRRLVDEGQVVSPGTVVLELMELDHPRVRIGVPVEVARDLELSAEVRVRLGGREVTARPLTLLPEQSSRTRTVDLLLELDEELGELRAGETATLRVPSRESGDGYLLPLSALTESARGLWSCLVAVPSSDADGVHRLESRPVEVVEVTAADGGQPRAWVRGAIEPGDRVVAEGLQRLVPGQTVRIAGVTP